MRRMVGTAAFVVAIALLAAGCFGSGGNKAAAPATTTGTHTPVTITFWSAYVDRELRDYQQAFAGFHRKYPWITVKGVGGQDDPKILAAISAHKPPDAVLSFSPDNTGKFCVNGAWQNLGPYIEQDHLNLGIFPKSAISYSQYKGDQCALPALADSYGLYYNKDLLAKAGIKSPPRTLSQLQNDAIKLTTYNPDGSIKVAGFVPLVHSYYQDLLGGLVPAFGAHWLTSDQKSAVASDPRWARMLRWQKQFVDKFGYDKLVHFVAGKGDEFSAQQDFEKGRVAMLFDGEWRNANIAVDHSKVHYGTAPFPAASPALYGGGQIGGDIVAIPRGSAHPAEAWLLIKYLSTNTPALVGLANRLKNLPTTSATLHSRSLTSQPQFATFLKIFADPHSRFAPLTPAGLEYQNDMGTFVEKWQAGKVADLKQGLADTASAMNASLQQAG
jgi:multiple sugar transport system substrate-binding protein